MSVRAGEKIPLVRHLECPDSEPVFVGATLKRPDRTLLVAFEVNLSDEGSGVFFDESVDMPDERYITATYRVYEDAGKTIESKRYCSVTAIFTRDNSDAGSVIVTNTPDRIVAKVKGETFDAKVSDIGPYKILIDDPESRAQLLEDSNNLRENQDINIIRSE